MKNPEMYPKLLNSISIFKDHIKINHKIQNMYVTNCNLSVFFSSNLADTLMCMVCLFKVLFSYCSFFLIDSFF